MINITKMSLIPIIFLFVVYLGIHIFLGKKVEQLKKELKLNPGNIETEKLLKNYTLSFKWFPFVYVILTIMILMSM